MRKIRKGLSAGAALRLSNYSSCREEAKRRTADAPSRRGWFFRL
ncbi:MAG TPA: hypothetical protein VG013_41605 [Gemmataceae bacterium]|nr:hypothetical protein [Gemmataceae bacterium]